MKKPLILLLIVITCFSVSFAQQAKTKNEIKNPKEPAANADKPAPKPKKTSSGSKKNAVLTDTLVDDRNGHVYELMKFGNAYWMTENLKYKSRSNTMYENDLNNLKKYGRMYTYEESKLACPSGSHLPTFQDWDSLVKFVDPREEGDAGDKLVKKQGFAVVMGGYKNAKGKFAGIESETTYWAVDASVQFSGDVQGAVINLNPTLEDRELKNAYYIRCIKD